MAESSDFGRHPVISGWLYKWTNYISRYQKRWFVLTNGFLSYYINQEEMGYRCRGTLSLHEATIWSDGENDFAVSNGDTYHLKALGKEEKQRWMLGLATAKDSASRRDDVSPIAEMIVTLRKALDDMKKCNSLVTSHGIALRRSLSDIDSSVVEGNSNRKMKDFNEYVALFRVSTTSMIQACSDYLDLAEYHCNNWATLDDSGKKQRIQLDEVVKTLIQVPSKNIEHEWKTDDDVSIFYDCEASNSPPESDLSGYHAVVCCPAVVGNPSKRDDPPVARVRRTRVPDKPNVSANLWNIIKNAVGKDLSKIPIPVNFSEPLSLLQRLTEDFEYADILDRASSLTDPAEQLAHVACFAVTSYSTTIARTGKPFNPILGETFECDRMDDLGWKSIAEQVSHHPPITALHCQGKQWDCWQEQSMHSKFRGQYLQVIPQGEVHVKFKSGNHFAWKKVTTNIHNIIIGKLWIDQDGCMEVKCYTNGFHSKMTFQTPGYFGGEAHKLSGTVFSKDGTPRFTISGGYDSKLEISPLVEAHLKIPKATLNPPETPVAVWERRMPPPDSDRYYNFTLFACQLNEMEDGIAPTDSRRRPDQRLMEEGKFDKANETKLQLEELQRSMRKKRQEETLPAKSNESFDPFTPVWFVKDKDPDTRTEIHVYRGEYWQCKNKQDWSRCPQIYM